MVCFIMLEGRSFTSEPCTLPDGNMSGKLCILAFNRLYAKLIYANNRLIAKLILNDIATSTKRLCTAFVYNSQSSNGVQNIMSKLLKHYKHLTKAVWPYATLKLYPKA